MGFAFRTMIFVVSFNLAVGMLIYLFGQSYWLTGMDTNTGLADTDALYAEFGEGSGVPVEEPGFYYRFLDVVNLGFFNKIKDFLNTTIFAIPTLLTRLGLLDTGMRVFANSIITLVFIIGMFDIFTGKDLTEK